MFPKPIARLGYAGNADTAVSQDLGAQHSTSSKAASALVPAANGGMAPEGFRAFSQQHQKLTWPMRHAASTDDRDTDNLEQWHRDLLTCVHLPIRGLQLHELLTCTHPHLKVHKPMVLQKFCWYMYNMHLACTSLLAAQAPLPSNMLASRLAKQQQIFSQHMRLQPMLPQLRFEPLSISAVVPKKASGLAISFASLPCSGYCAVISRNATAGNPTTVTTLPTPATLQMHTCSHHCRLGAADLLCHCSCR